MTNLKSKALDFTQNFVIALDGPAASGKGTIGFMLAEKFSLKYVQSSIVYRQLAFNCIKEKIDITDINKVISLSKEIDITDKYDLEDENIGGVASQIAVIAKVRDSLNKHLVRLINITPRILMEGRDIGTIVAPNADFKIFITANPGVRAERRYKQLQAKGKACILDEILQQIILRDKRDKEREVAPLLPALDALIIDTSKLSPLSVVEQITQFILKE
ncbi:MAG TPA: (d)CMP kinase [Rickettsia endosymbiont of Degeeriella rufa]|nr:(d)CMP kinase [Rickettsia endosymbiont of Columbicola hoogstraali]HJD61997.1 (d)CMP kinase [Rickettsia endosymbiont of Degeeriella rufa]